MAFIVHTGYVVAAVARLNSPASSVVPEPNTRCRCPAWMELIVMPCP